MDSLRLPVLGVVAAVGVVAVVVDSVWVRSAGDRAPGPDAVAVEPGDALSAGAPPGLDRAALDARYGPLLQADPFRLRSFRAPPKPAPRRAAPPRPTPSGPPPVELRLTGTVGQDAGRAGVLEARGTGTGLLAAVGDRIGPSQVAAIHTGGLVLDEAGKQRTLALGEKLEVPAAQAPALTPLHTATVAKPKGVATSSGPPLSDDKRQSILERLRARRRASMQDDSGEGD